jgi:hypothetical protein
MKKVFALAIGLIFLSIFARTTFAAPVKTTQLPFKVKGTLQSDEKYVINYPLTSVTASGSGEANQLGLFTVQYKGQVNMLDLSRVRSVHFLAANGESLYANAAGQAFESGMLNIYNVIEIYKITGGTGWLTNASGTITAHLVLNTTTGHTSGSFEGIILIP